MVNYSCPFVVVVVVVLVIVVVVVIIMIMTTMTTTLFNSLQFLVARCSLLLIYHLLRTPKQNKK